jgi:DNA-binding NarL/FixJ family response regulator
VFKPKSEEVLEVNHIDGVKKNNCASNLEWVTKRENIIHAIRNGLIKPPILIGEDASKASLTTKQVHKICKLIENGYRNKEISEMFEIKKSNIVGQIRRRKTWTHISKDYKW